MFKKYISIAVLGLLVSNTSYAVQVVQEECLVNENMIYVVLKGGSGDPLKQYAKIRLVRPENSNEGLSPIIGTSEEKTLYKYGEEVNFSEDDVGASQIKYGDKLVVWTETYNHYEVIYCDG